MGSYLLFSCSFRKCPNQIGILSFYIVQVSVCNHPIPWFLCSLNLFWIVPYCHIFHVHVQGRRTYGNKSWGKFFLEKKAIIYQCSFRTVAYCISVLHSPNNPRHDLKVPRKFYIFNPLQKPNEILLHSSMSSIIPVAFEVCISEKKGIEFPRKFHATTTFR